jgi:hypothetical protein
MRRLLSKLGFVHRTLWRRDPVYRWAVLLGPPPLAGCLLAACAWAILWRTAPVLVPPSSDIPWAQWTRPTQAEGQPFAEPPTGPLPPRDANGRFPGFQTGWVGLIQPMTVDATQDARISPQVMAHFAIDQPTIPLARVLDAGPPAGLFVGTAKTLFPVQVPGLYAFSARFTRSNPQSADCIVWLESAKHRMVRAIDLNMNGQAVLNFPPTEFRLEPGMFLLEIAVGCWRGDQMVGPGELTVMVRHPNEATLEPATADELIKPQPPRASGTSVNVTPPR